MSSRRIVTAVAIVLSLFSIIYVGVQAAGLLQSGYTTETVYQMSVSQSVSVQGVFVREEVPIPIDSAGRVVSPLYSVGTKVAVNTELGSIYDDMSAVRAQYRAQNIQTTASALERAQEAVTSTDVIRPETLNGQIADSMAQLVAMRDSRDLSGLSEIRGQLTEAMAKRAIVVDGVEGYSERIAALKNDLSELESLASSQTQTFTSTAAGYFVDHVDGYEETMTKEYLDTLSASELRDWLAGYSGYNGSQSAVKIVTNHRWIFAASVDEEQMRLLSNIDSVLLNFPGVEENVKTSIISTEREEETGLYKVEFEGDLVSEPLLSSRVLTAEIDIRTYTGIRIPKGAIRFQDGQKGVYVQNGSKIHFRYIDQIYETTDYVLSRPYYEGELGAEEYVKLYDTVVVGGKGLYDEKLVQ